MKGTELIEAPDNGHSAAGQVLAAGAALQQVRTTYATAIAVQKPRRLMDVQRRIQEEARLAGDEFYYGWGAGKDAIEGPSVKLALALARCWGNCAIETLPVQDLMDCWIFTAAFVDLETGFTLTRQFRQSKKWAVHGKLDAERKDDIRFQIGQSKAVRNVMLNALPASLVTKAIQAAKEGVRAELEELVNKHSLAHVADRLVSALGKCGVKEAALLERCGVADRKGLNLEHLVILRGDLTALQEGQERAEVLFPALVQPPSPPAPPAPPRAEADAGATQAPAVPGGEAAKTQTAPAAKPAGGKVATKPQLKSIGELFSRLRWTAEKVNTTFLRWDCVTASELTSMQAVEVIAYLTGELEGAEGGTEGGGEEPPQGDAYEG